VAARTALFDSCVLYSAPITDLVMQISVEGLVRARWTERIHQEWIRHLGFHRPDLEPGQLLRRRDLMNLHAEGCLVDGYQRLIDGLALPDPEDRHVLAAAIHARASAIVTFDLRHFPAGILGSFGIEARHPDDFLCQLFQEDSLGFRAAVRRQRSSLRRPARTASELLDTFARVGLPATSERLREFVHDL
jgi:hypothetical protein